MKNIAKNLLLSIAIISLLLALASCNFGGLLGGNNEQTETKAPTQTTKPQQITTPAQTTAPEDIPGPNKPDAKKQFCEELSALSGNPYGKIELGVTTTSAGNTLNSTFVLTEKEVEYSIEKLATFQINEDGSVVIPESFKETFVGTAVLSDKNDAIIFDGEILLVSDYNVLSGGFSFVAENIGDYNKQDGEITTVVFKVLDACDFLGVEIDDAKGMTVTVSYSPDAIIAMTVEYSTNNSQVVLNYSFS